MRKRRSKLTPLARVLRRSGNIAEDRLRHYVRNRNLGGFKFYRSFTIGDYITDFACPELNLVIELDGSQHTIEADQERNDFILSEGWAIARFPSGHILSQPDSVLETIAAICEGRINAHIIDHDFQFYPRSEMAANDVTPHPDPLPSGGERGKDSEFMKQALRLGMDQMGRTWPNPSVGCVIVKDGQIIATGATGDGGRPHAEEIALNKAGDTAKGATAYVTLEPCGERSNGGCSCSQRLVEAGVVRVVYACDDPSPFASHIGVERLKTAGIAIETGLLADEAAPVIAGFVHYIKTGLPLVQESLTGEGFDAEFTPESTADLPGELTLWAQKGYRHIYVKPHSDLAKALRFKDILPE